LSFASPPAIFCTRAALRRIVRISELAAASEVSMSNFDRNAAPWSRGYARTGADVDQGLRTFMLGVYNHMTIGLALTGLSALGVFKMAVAGAGVVTAYHFRSIYLTDFGYALYASPLRWVAMFAPLAFVLFFSFKINTMAASSARNLFYAFSAVMGVSLSSILLIYKGDSVAQALFITSATFGALSIYGYTTKRSLSAMGSFLVMGLFGIIIAGIVNMFVQSAAFQYGLSFLTVLIFSGLTAWDTQSIKSMYLESDGYEVATKKSINGALMLYLDFINIFTALIQLTGDRDN
jgi:FtsH-binding integral membrane protein